MDIGSALHLSKGFSKKHILLKAQFFTTWVNDRVSIEASDLDDAPTLKTFGNSDKTEA